jgi:hypothetical protein
MSFIVFEKRSSNISLNIFQMHHVVWKTYRFPFLATVEEECRNRIVIHNYATPPQTKDVQHQP